MVKIEFDCNFSGWQSFKRNAAFLIYRIKDMCVEQVLKGKETGSVWNIVSAACGNIVLPY